MKAQVQIWITDRTLKESDWLDYGHKSLADYVVKLSKEGEEKLIRESQHLPLVTFGLFNTKTGEKDIKLICNTVDDLPTQSIEGILEFNDSNDRRPIEERSNE